MVPDLKEEISLIQLCMLIIIYEIGTAAVVGIGADAKQDVWISIIISTLIGMGLMAMYHEMIKRFPGNNFYDLLQICFGKFVAKIIAQIYIVYFFYISARVIRDFAELLVTVVLPNTPIEFTTILFMFVVSYIMYLGFEVFSRTAETFTPYIFVFLMLITLFLLINQSINFNNLKPILYNGVTPIIKAVFPGIMTFPFGELIVFTVVMNQVREIKIGKKYVIIAVFVSGLVIAYHGILNITVLGVDTYTRTSFPLLMSAREISIAQFVERIDPLVVFIVMLGVFVKASIYFYCVLKGLEYTYQIPFRYYSFPVGLLVAPISILIANNYDEHIYEGIDIVPLYLHIPLQYVFPILVFVVLLIKSRKGGKSNVQNSKQKQEQKQKQSEEPATGNG